MNNTYKMSHRVSYSEADLSYRMRPDGILNCFQDITGLHSEELGTDGKTLKEKSNAFWVLSKVKMRLHCFPAFDEEVELCTWPTDVGGVRFGRDFTISTPGGETLVSLSSEWCTLDMENGRLRKAESVCYPHDMPHRADRAQSGEWIKGKEETGDCHLSYIAHPALTDIDTNRHTNNVAYLKMALNSFRPEDYEALALKEVQIHFISQTYWGDSVGIYKKPTDYGFFIEGRHGGKQVFTCALVCEK